MKTIIQLFLFLYYIGVIILIGIIIYGTKQQSLHYSFGLCTTAGALAVIVAGVTAFDAFKKPNEPLPPQQQFQMAYYPQGTQFQYPTAPPSGHPQMVPAQMAYPPPYTPTNQGVVPTQNQVTHDNYPTKAGSENMYEQLRY